jgi:hypothetical protein
MWDPENSTKNILSGDDYPEWLGKFTNVMLDDCVSLWHIYGVGEEQFRLSGSDLDKFANHTITALIRAGGRPAWGDSQLKALRSTAEFGDDADEIGNNMQAWWTARGGRVDLPESPWIMPSVS